jgi:hypothetical protein
MAFVDLHFPDTAMLQQQYIQNLQPVIAASWFTIDPRTFVYASVQQVTHAEKHLMVTRDGAETTIITDINNFPLDGGCVVNKEKWKLVNIRCGNPFYCVGFIAFITGSLANAGIDIVLVSSFSNDLVLVMDKDMDKAVLVLKEIGFKEEA